MHQPFFSIIIPTYNRAHLIEKTIESLLNQRFKDYEIIVIDDGSTDNTKEVLLPYISDHFHYFYQENAERNAARNRGTANAKGQYINWFDSDDIALPNHLETFYNYIIENNYPKALHSNYDDIDIDGKQIKTHFDFPKILNPILYKGNCLSTNNIIVSRELALLLPFEEDRNLLSEDFEMWLRFAAETNIYNIPIHTSSYIFHSKRSVYEAKPKEKLIKGYLLFLELIDKNNKVVAFLGNKYSFFKMRNLLILSVELANNGYKKCAITYLFKAMKNDIRFIFDKTFYAILKNLILK